MGRNLVDQPSKNEIEIACSFAHGSQWDFGKIPNGDSNNLWARRARFFFYIFLQNVQDQKQNKSHKQMARNSPSLMHRVWQPSSSSENEIEIVLVLHTGDYTDTEK